MNIAADTKQNNSFRACIQIIERDIELTFFQKKDVTDSCLIATKNSCLGSILRTTTRETVCFRLSLSLLKETPKQQFSRMKGIEDIQLLFVSYRIRILVSW